MKDVSTRAVNDNQEDYGGRTEESKLTELQLLSNVHLKDMDVRNGS